MKKLAFVLAVLLVLASFSVAYCDTVKWGFTDTYQQLRRQLPYDLIYRGAQRGGVSDIVSTVSGLDDTHLAFSILRLSGATKTFTMDDGVTGQSITLVKSENDERTLKLSFRGGVDAGHITATAHTGFTDVTFPTAAGSFVTLAWIDSTVGWIITGSSGVTITY